MSRGPISDDEGFVTIQFVAVCGLSFLMLVVMLNLIVFMYGKGVVRAAVDEGTRTGSRATSDAAECQARAQDVVDDLLGGAMGDGIEISCEEGPRAVRAIARARFEGWVPMVPDWSFQLSSVGVKEREPE